MTAKEALRRSKKAALERVLGLIDVRIEMGRTELTVSSDLLNSDIITQLKANGYKITKINHYGDTYISWNK